MTAKPGPNAGRWQIKLLQSRLPWDAQPVRPAEVSSGLRSVMLARENILEDVNYFKIVPNRYVVEVSPDNYTRNYQPIENRVVLQWREKLLEHLTTTNRRMGRKEYRFGGPVLIQIRPAADLHENQVRILSQVHPGEVVAAHEEQKPGACLVMSPGGQRWAVGLGTTLLGRDGNCDIRLDLPLIQERRLVSGQHAYIRYANGQYRIFDGSPDGKPSLNGTYVNYRRVPAGGVNLEEGDMVILAALDPDHPLPDTPGVVTFRFQQNCTA